MNEQMKRIASVIYTLNQMEVRGRENLDRLLGCILTLEKLKAEMEVSADAEDNAGERADA